MASAMAVASAGGVSRPVAAAASNAGSTAVPPGALDSVRICSGIPPTAVAMTGVPQARASMMEFGKVSARAACR